ncbi:zf-TFIIB domain-containing protein [Chloroflexota bacterium]
MICPVCKCDMIVVEYHNTELDYCTGCKGVWFDSGELELLLESNSLEKAKLAIDSSLHSQEPISSEKKRKCPICGHKMKKATMGEKPQILIDVCGEEHGLWFDGGEVAQLIRHLPGEQLPKGDSRDQVIGFLEEVFKAPE